jgi:hypothetical protein
MSESFICVFAYPGTILFYKVIIFTSSYVLNQDILISVVTGCGPDCQGSIPGKDREFTLCHNVEVDSWAYPVFCSMSTGGKTAEV